MYFGFVYELIGWQPRPDDKIVGFQGKFLLSPLIASTITMNLGRSDIFEAHLFQFFRSVGAGVRAFGIVLLEGGQQPDEASARSFLASKVGGTDLILCSRVLWVNGNLNELLGPTSEFLRGSRSLVPAEFMEVGKLQVVADAKGLAVIDPVPMNGSTADRFFRACQVVALGNAYGSVLDRLIVSLSDAGLQMGKTAESALKEWSRFMSAYYFSEPVRLDTIELSRLYNAVKDRQKLDVLAQEATEQLRLLAELVRLDRYEVLAKKDSGAQVRLTIFGLILTGLGLVQVVQVTPKAVSEFLGSWGECSQRFGWGDCLTGGWRDDVVDVPADKVKRVRQPKR